MTPGNRLRRARKLNGFNSQQDLSDHIYNTTGQRISRQRIGRLENDKGIDTEQQTLICKALDMSPDWYLMGDEQAPDVLYKRINELSEQRRKIALQLIDAVAGMEV